MGGNSLGVGCGGGHGMGPGRGKRRERDPCSVGRVAAFALHTASHRTSKIAWMRQRRARAHLCVYAHMHASASPHARSHACGWTCAAGGASVMHA